MNSSSNGRKGRGPSLQVLQRASFLALAAGLMAKPALAQVSTPTVDPLFTSVEGDITVTSAGSITIDTDDTAAITLDSDNAVLNQGDLLSVDDEGTVGILIDGAGNHTGLVQNEDVIGLTETYAPADSDSDGNLDGEWSQLGDPGEDPRYGIHLTPGGSFTGDIEQSSAGRITVHGDNSAGVRLDSVLNGDLNLAGVITVRGDNSVGVDINDFVSRDVIIDATVTASGEGAIGIDVGADITGSVNIGGTVTTTGYFSTARPTAAQDAAFDADDRLQGGSAVVIAADVAGGVVIKGIGIEDDEDDDDDGILDNATTNPDTNDDATATIRSFGEAPAVLIDGTGGPITLGNADPFGQNRFGQGFTNRGVISANGLQDGIEGTAIRITGDVTIDGFQNDGRISALAYDANAFGIDIGSGASIPVLSNRNSITADVVDVANDGSGFNAYGLRFASGADLTDFFNTGTIIATINGVEGNAIAVADENSLLQSFTNSGTIIARAVGAAGSVFEGEAIALDFSANHSGIEVNQEAPSAVQMDEDLTDNTPDPLVQIIGDIRFGNGADSLNIDAGSVIGDIYFGDGADALSINFGATVRGVLNDTGGGLFIEVQNSTLEVLGAGGVTAGVLDMGTSDGVIGGDATLIVHLSGTASDSVLFQTTGEFTLAAGATIVPIISFTDEGLPTDGAITFIDAGSLDIGAGVLGLVTGTGVPWIYDVTIQTELGDATNLQAAYELKTADELMLDRNEAAAFGAILAALRSDDDAATGFVGLDSQASFDAGLADMMPNFSSGVTEITATTIAQGQRASSHRLAAARLSGQRDSSIWVQEVAFNIEREAETYGADFEGSGFGVAAGIDGLMNNGAIFGVSLAFVGAENEATDKTENVGSLQLGQANAYLGFGMGPIDIDAVIGAGVGRISLRRDIAFGGYSVSNEADYMTYEGHASVRASAPFELSDWLVIRPYAEALYIGMQENEYEEEGAGAVDMIADSVFSQRLWGEIGTEISVPVRLFGTNLAPKITVGYRADLLEDETERTYRFNHAGALPFTLVDESVGEGAPIAGFALQGGDEGTQITVSYEGEFGDTLERHSLLAGLRFRF